MNFKKIYVNGIKFIERSKLEVCNKFRRVNDHLLTNFKFFKNVQAKH
jgi:hypothetical protein